MQAYEARLNPFVEFQQHETESHVNKLNLHDRALLSGSRHASTSSRCLACGLSLSQSECIENKVQSESCRFTAVQCCCAQWAFITPLSTTSIVRQPVGERVNLAAQHCAAIHKHCICNMQHFLALAVLL